MVKGGQRWAHDAAHLGDGNHVAQVGEVQRRLAHHQHQAAALFEHHVGRARQQVVGQAMGNGRQRAHGARRHHHGMALERAAGNRGAHVVHVMHLVRKGLGSRALHAQLMLQVAPACVRDNQVRLDAGQAPQHLQQPCAIHGAAGTRYGDDDATGAHRLSHAGPSRRHWRARARPAGRPLPAPAPGRPARGQNLRGCVFSRRIAAAGNGGRPQCRGAPACF